MLSIFPEIKPQSQALNSDKTSVENSDKNSAPEKVVESSLESAAMEVDKEEKSRDEIKAEREAKKQAKALAKQGLKPKTGNDVIPTGNEATKAETSSDAGKSKAELKAERRAKQEAQRGAKEQQKNPAPSAGLMTRNFDLKYLIFFNTHLGYPLNFIFIFHGKNT